MSVGQISYVTATGSTDNSGAITDIFTPATGTQYIVLSLISSFSTANTGMLSTTLTSASPSETITILAQPYANNSGNASITTKFMIDDNITIGISATANESLTYNLYITMIQIA